jgi:predicted O-methyltransferase YrrM
MITSKIWELLHLSVPPPKSTQWTCEEFSTQLESNLESCQWDVHPLHSVFTQYDRQYYLERRDAFIKKYRSFYVVSKTIAPRSIIELGTSAGSGADAYLSATPSAKYTGIDVFCDGTFSDGQTSWKPYDIAVRLLTDRKFKNWKLIKKDLRQMNKLPSKADLVVVDAAHDVDSEYADLQLALTARPTFIFVDDADAEKEAKPAIEKFLQEDLHNQVEYTCPVSYIGGGLVIRLKV